MSDMQTPIETLINAISHISDRHKEGLPHDKELVDRTVKLAKELNKDLYQENEYIPSTRVETRQEDLEEHMNDVLDLDSEDDEEKEEAEEIDFSEEPEED
jgi:hypothetical protein